MLAGEGSPNQIKKWKKQRAERGFSDFDVMDIDDWFLMIVPEMLDELIKHYQGYPSWMECEYRNKNNLIHSELNNEQQDKMDKICMKKWEIILKKMRKAFIKATESGYSHTYNDPSRKKALSLFVKYFDDLWY